jgi:hypothetical protein
VNKLRVVSSLGNPGIRGTLFGKHYTVYTINSTVNLLILLPRLRRQHERLNNKYEYFYIIRLGITQAEIKQLFTVFPSRFSLQFTVSHHKPLTCELPPRVWNGSFQQETIPASQRIPKVNVLACLTPFEST